MRTHCNTLDSKYILNTSKQQKVDTDNHERVLVNAKYLRIKINGGFPEMKKGIF